MLRGSKFPDQRESVLPWQRNINERQSRSKSLDFPECLLCIVGKAANLQILFSIDQLDQTFAKDRVILNNEDTVAHAVVGLLAYVYLAGQGLASGNPQLYPGQG